MVNNKEKFSNYLEQDIADIISKSHYNKVRDNNRDYAHEPYNDSNFYDNERSKNLENNLDRNYENYIDKNRYVKKTESNLSRASLDYPDRGYRPVSKVRDNNNYDYRIRKVEKDREKIKNRYLPFDEEEIRPLTQQNKFSESFVESLLLDALMPAIAEWLDANIDRITAEVIQNNLDTKKLRPANRNEYYKRYLNND